MSVQLFSAAMSELGDKYIMEAATYQPNKMQIRTPFFGMSRRAIAVIAAIMVLLTTACAVQPIREAIVRFVIEACDTFWHYTFEGEIPQVFEKRYSFTVPDGFTQTFEADDETGVSLWYENEAGDELYFRQYVTDSDLHIDAEHTTKEVIEAAGHEVHYFVYRGGEITIAMWLNEGYIFEVSYHGDITQEEMIKLIEGVKYEGE